MPRTQRKSSGLNAPVTRGDLKEFTEFMEKNFEGIRKRFDGIDEHSRGVDKRLDGIEQNMISKQDQEELEDRIAEKAANRVEASWEKREADLEDIHQDQLDIVAGEKTAPEQWRTIPRRLFTAEKNIREIKDHLRIS